MRNRIITKLANSALLAIAMVVVSCNNEGVITYAENTTCSKSINNTHVSLQNVQALIGALHSQTRAAEIDECISVLDSRDGDTLFYVVNNPEGGWTMYASDTRIPAIVAENPSDKFCLEEMEKVMDKWWDAMKEDMKNVKRADDEDLNFTKEEIERNKSFWEAVRNPDKFIQTQNKQTRFGDDPLPITPGHYELVSVTSYEEVYDSIGHVLPTHWSQYGPYNYYCPQKTEGYGNAPAGCVAIAGAQMLYYLHYKLGVPEAIPDSASCIGNINNPIMNQWHPSTTVWNYLIPNHGNSSDGIYVAPLIANVGKLVGMTYGNTGSGAYTSDLVDNVFNVYGISCYYHDFITTSLEESLLDSIPAIACAYATVSQYGNQTIYSDGHTFIVDAYKRTKTVTVYSYSWVPDPQGGSTGPGGALQPIGTMPDIVEYEYSSPHIYYFKMNWGWGYHPADNTWYTYSGNWLAGNYSFDYVRKMVSAFSVI